MGQTHVALCIKSVLSFAPSHEMCHSHADSQRQGRPFCLAHQPPPSALTRSASPEANRQPSPMYRSVSPPLRQRDPERDGRRGSRNPSPVPRRTGLPAQPRRRGVSPVPRRSDDRTRDSRPSGRRPRADAGSERRDDSRHRRGASPVPSQRIRDDDRQRGGLPDSRRGRDAAPAGDPQGSVPRDGRRPAASPAHLSRSSRREGDRAPPPEAEQEPLRRDSEADLRRERSRSAARHPSADAQPADVPPQLQVAPRRADDDSSRQRSSSRQPADGRAITCETGRPSLNACFQAVNTIPA